MSGHPVWGEWETGHAQEAVRWLSLFKLFVETLQRHCLFVQLSFIQLSCMQLSFFRKLYMQYPHTTHTSYPSVWRLLFQGFWSHSCQPSPSQTSPLRHSQGNHLNQQGTVRLNTDIHDQLEWGYTHACTHAHTNTHTHTHTVTHLTPLSGECFSRVSGQTGLW